jgi:hypothetical protein
LYCSNAVSLSKSSCKFAIDFLTEVKTKGNPLLFRNSVFVSISDIEFANHSFRFSSTLDNCSSFNLGNQTLLFKLSGKSGCLYCQDE